LTTCINIVLDAEKKLNEAHGDIATAISGKLNRVLLKNKGWKQLLNIITILCGVSSDEINYHGFDLNFKRNLLHEVCTDHFSGCRAFVFYV